MPHCTGTLLRLKRLRSRLSLGLTLLTLSLYFSFILLIAFAPHWLTVPVGEGSRLTHGILLGLGLYAFCVAVTGYYVWHANRHIDPLLRELHSAASAAAPQASSSRGTA